MKVRPFVFNKMNVNSFVVWNEADGASLLIDPGCVTEAEQAELDAFLKDNGLRPLAVLATHPHFDHIAGADRFCRQYGIECHICELDLNLSGMQDEMSHLYDFKFEGNAAPTRYFAPERQELRFGSITVDVLPLSGHTLGSVAYHFAEAKAVFVGDTIVKGTLGLQETGFRQTLQRIHDYLLPLPDDTRVFPGHGDFSTIGEERVGNRFFRRSATLD